LPTSRWKTVQEEDRQNKELLGLSKQILSLTKEVRSYGDTVERENKQNEELLELSKRTLALTTEVHSLAGAGAATSKPAPEQPSP
jgi:hypothetical protein